MKIAIACMCLCMVVASNAFPLFGDGMMGAMMMNNMMTGRNMFDFNSLFGGASTTNQQQGQAVPAQGAATQGAAATTGSQQGAMARGGGLFGKMNPIVSLSLLGGGEMMGF